MVYYQFKCCDRTFSQKEINKATEISSGIINQKIQDVHNENVFVCPYCKEWVKYIKNNNEDSDITETKLYIKKHRGGKYVL